MPDHRKAAPFLILTALGFVLFVATLIDAKMRRQLATDKIELLGRTVHELQLTDLSLFTEARYTRHPSQADRFSALQDHPMALEHFPSGSLLMPPSLLRDP